MTESSGRTILVFSENADALLELLTAARELHGASAGRIIAAAAGANAANAAADCASSGADDAFVLGLPRDRAAGAEDLSAALRVLVQTAEPDVMLIGATRTGTEVAASLAQLLDVPCASECTALAFDAGGQLVIERRVYAGRFLARQVFTGYPCVLTIALKRFPKAEPEGRRGNVHDLSVDLPPPRVEVRAVAPRSRSERDVTKASAIVTAGRGVKKREDLEMLDRLAAVLNGVLAGTRPLTGDLDWLPVDRRIGLSGQTVKPNLYIACGVSGQIEHIVGMKGARTVVAINADPKAPIHAEADYSIVGDLYEIVPALLAACEQQAPPAEAGAKSGTSP